MSEFQWVAVALVTVLSSARITRLLIFDKFPPIKWVKDRYADLTDGTGWQWLVFCPYCMAPWVTAAVLGSGYLSDWHTVWWLVNAWFGASYLAAIVMVLDADTSEDDD